MEFAAIQPNGDCQNLQNDLLQAMARYDGVIPEDEMLAILASLVGQMIAVQDPKKLSAAEALCLVQANVNHGAEGALAKLAGRPVH